MMPANHRHALDLAWQSYGETGEPIVILHGLLGSGRNWTTLAKQLGETHQVFVLDLRNHGASPWADEMTYELLASDVRQFIESQELGPVILIGHSMGGKTAMRTALDRPSLIDKLVVVDIAPVVYQHSFGGYVEAMQAINVANVSSRNEVGDRLSTVVPEAGVRAFILQNLLRKDQGFAWRVNLDSLAKAMPALMTFPSTSADQFGNPALFLAGANSDYVLPDHQREIMRLFPHAVTRYIDNASHWLHAEQPERFLEHVQAFLSTASA